MDPAFWTFRPDNAEALKRGVEQAFADAVYPGDDKIIVSGNPECCAECGETHAVFQGMHWRDLVERGQDLQPVGWGGLALLKPAAWRFYLPAYLVVSLRGDDQAESALTCALYSLAPPAEEDATPQTRRSAECFNERTAGLSVAQQACVAAIAWAAVESGGDDPAFAAAAR